VRGIEKPHARGIGIHHDGLGVGAISGETDALER
jgi:hypothetical protein